LRLSLLFFATFAAFAPFLAAFGQRLLAGGWRKLLTAKFIKKGREERKGKHIAFTIRPEIRLAR
jgi:hypothetical protein